MYNKRICNEIKKILKYYFEKKDVDIVCKYMLNYVNIQIPLSINDSLIDIPYGIKNRLIAVYDIDNITITFKEDELPDYIEYIGKKEDIIIHIDDLTLDRFKILKSILNYHVGYDISLFESQKMQITLSDLAKYKIPILLPDILSLEDCNDNDYVVINNEKNQLIINKMIQMKNIGNSVKIIYEYELLNNIPTIIIKNYNI